MKLILAFVAGFATAMAVAALNGLNARPVPTRPRLTPSYEDRVQFHLDRERDR